MPMPEAMAKGLLLRKVDSAVPRAADRQVAASTPAESMPVADR